MKDELVTCAFTTFNSSETIERAINSAINQTYKNIEIIVVDDNSEDNTVEIIKNIALKKDILIKIFALKTNKGVGNARNICIKNANGSFICFFDDDDFSYALRVEKQLSKLLEFEINNFISNYKISALCYSDRYIHYKNKKKLLCRAMNINKLDKNKDKIINSMLYADNFPSNSRVGSTATCTLFARKCTFLQISLFNDSLRRCEDTDLAIRALMNNIYLISTDSVLLDQYYNSTPDKKNSFFYEFKLIKLHKKWLDKFGLYEFSKSFLRLKYAFHKLDYFLFNYTFLILITHYPIKTLKRIFSSSRTILFSMLHRLRM